MKTTIRILSIVLSFSLFQCTTTEEIWINKDGSLKREVKFDMSALAMLLQMEEDGADEEEAPADGDAFDQMFGNLMKREYVDTLIEFKTLFMEELGENGYTEEDLMRELSDEYGGLADEKKTKDLVKVLLKSQMRLKIDQSRSEFLMSMIQEFDNADEIDAGLNMMEVLSNLGNQGLDEDPETSAMAKMMSGGSPTYSLSKKEFRIFRPATDLSGMDEETRSSMEMMQAMMGESGYTYVIHVPKKVKKVNVKGAVIEGNTVTIEAPMVMSGEENKPFELVLNYK